MKNTLFFLFLFLLIGSPSIAQEYFEGELTYTIELSGEGADEMAAFMPESYSYTVKGSNLKFVMKGGLTAAFMGDFIFNGESNKTYMVNHNLQVAYDIPADENEMDTISPKATVSKENEIFDILGYQCQKYKVVTQSEEGEEITQYLWTTDKIKFENIKKANQLGGNGSMAIDGVDGMPLKIVSEISGFTMVMTAKSINKSTVDPESFKIPSNYQIEIFDPNTFMGGQN